MKALLLMNMHKAVLHSIDPEKVIDMLGKKSALMHQFVMWQLLITRVHC
jgi:hypothetical protein